MQNVFVYGTLKSGFGNNRLMTPEGSRLIGKAVTVDKFDLRCFGGCPGMFPKGDNMRHVEGELWEVNNSVLASLDRLEGHPGWYRRTPIKVRLGPDRLDGAHFVDCETYIIHQEARGTPCTEGKWPIVNRKLEAGRLDSHRRTGNR